MAIPLKYKTISAPAVAEFRDRGSKFLAFAYPVDNVEELKLHVKKLKADHPKAAHHCVAFRIGHDRPALRSGAPRDGDNVCAICLGLSQSA